MEELDSPISAFLGDRCVLDPREIVSVATLYKVWRSWCQEHGRDAVGDEPSLGPDLHAASPSLSKSRVREGSLRITHYRLRFPLNLSCVRKTIRNMLFGNLLWQQTRSSYCTLSRLLVL